MSEGYSEAAASELIDVYTDEGITGTSTKRREGFKQMIADVLAGRIAVLRL